MCVDNTEARHMGLFGHTQTWEVVSAWVSLRIHVRDYITLHVTC